MSLNPLSSSFVFEIKFLELNVGSSSGRSEKKVFLVIYEAVM
jgi:hypothetical protein